MKSGYSWSSQPSNTIYYAGYGRLNSNGTPTLSCPSGDVYTLKVGLITIDEVSIAGGGGGLGSGSESYYLYTGQPYWTMTPYQYDDVYAYNFITYWGSVSIFSSGVDNSYGVRPVINLLANTQFETGGTGTSANPYVVI